ncbi:MAG: thioredoxin fold domain-containing protein [Synechococcus sp. SB0668_bin_15]|nr:thioredoxin fold domain-containing protein [Synechococcus sp. SB0668_bin_15]MXZ83758.1 thioredoxin fold domain-containing protein [Synechococcus sp. SB0666_bin_14]MYC49507.1 thioredoxin fold domain-containing protein [Synechococcus sp. SB0662_bin_14]
MEPPVLPSAMDNKDRAMAKALAIIAAVLAVVVFWARSLNSQGLEALAQASLPLDEALGNGKPTLVEFYADWCEVCHQMEPAMTHLKQTHRGALDLVLLNVDNPLWQEELEQFQVRGIPTVLFYGPDGRLRGRSIGLRQPEQLEAMVAALLRDDPLPHLSRQGITSAVTEANPSRNSAVGPRSHGEGVA